MRILHLDETFHPNFGYQCNPLAKFQKKLGNEVYIIAPEAKYIYPVYHNFGEYGDNLDNDDDIYIKNTGVKIIRVKARGYYFRRLLYKFDELNKAIENINPDAIFVHCVETITAMYVMRKYKNRYPMVFDSHMLSMATTSRFYKLFETLYKIFITKVIREKKYRVIKTQNDDYIETHLGVPKDQTKFISFGTDTELFKPNEEVKKHFISEHNLPENTFVIVSTSKLNAGKGGMLFAETVSSKFQTDRTVVIVIVANFASDYEKKVKEILDSGNNQVFYYPVQNYLNLPYFYQIADVTVFAKQCSMSFYDAQSCGSPVISENNNINIDRNSHGNGFCFQMGNKDDFKLKIEMIMNLSIDEYNIMRKKSFEFIKNNYSYELIAKQYTEEIKLSIKEFKNVEKN